MLDQLIEKIGDLFAPSTFLFWEFSPREVGEIVYCNGYTKDCRPGAYKITKCVQDKEIDTLYAVYGRHV